MALDAGDSAPRAWQSVLSHIETRLLAGELRLGDTLPGERALSAELGVGRSSVREALRVLEVMGLIRTSSGSGPAAGAVIVAAPEGGMSAFMRLQVAAQGFSVADIVQTRLLLESAVVTELVERRSDLGPAGALLDAMDDETLSADAFFALDGAFHLALATAAGNPVIAATMSGLRAAIESYARANVTSAAQWPETASRLRDEHRGIVEAVSVGDAREATTRVREHISGYYASGGRTA